VTNPLRLQAIREVGFEEGIRKTAALHGLTSADADYLIKLARYGDTNALETLGQAAKFGLVGPARAIGAPLSIPLSMLQAGGGAAGAQAAMENMPDSATKMLGGQGIGHSLHPSTASLLRRMQEVEAADPAMGAKMREYIGGLEDGTGTSGAAAGVGAGLAALGTAGSMGGSLPGNWLSSGIAGSGGQARFREGLEGDKAGFMRRWFDPTGYSTKNIAYEMQQQNPELAASILESLQAKHGG